MEGRSESKDRRSSRWITRNLGLLTRLSLYGKTFFSFSKFLMNSLNLRRTEWRLAVADAVAPSASEASVNCAWLL